MNGLTLRISRGGGKKFKSTLAYSTVLLPDEIIQSFAGNNSGLFKRFSLLKTAEEQLSLLKNILSNDDHNKEEMVNFLVAIFMQIDSKHPVKSFITRYITKTNHLQQLFAVTLSHQICRSMARQHTCYRDYVYMVSIIASCIENFPTGAEALKILDLRLIKYLRDCLQSANQTLRELKVLSPTEKNEIFNLAHLALRLLVHIIQKRDPSNCLDMNRKLIIEDVRVLIRDLLFNDDVPMDTKSVCGILYLCVHVLNNGADSWTQLLQSNSLECYTKTLFMCGAAKLSVLSAVASTVSATQLVRVLVEGRPALVVLTKHIQDIGESCSSECTFILGVARAVLQISKHLQRVTDKEPGLQVMESVLVFVWSHLEHYMDSVRHLTVQTFNCIVKYCTQLQKEGNVVPLSRLFLALGHLDRARKSYYVSVTALAAELGALGVITRIPTVIRDVMAALSVQAVQASATTTLETLLRKHVEESTSETIYRAWLQPVLRHVASNELEAGVINVLQKLLARAVDLDDNLMDYILPYIKESCQPTEGPPRDLKCILMLLSVARKSGVYKDVAEGSGEPRDWRGVISYHVLELAAVDASEETRILSLSLIVESPKTTEVFVQGEFDFVLYYLKYNINAQSPNFRQLTLSMMKKFTKRLEDSYKVLKRQKELKVCGYNGVDYYTGFVDKLRRRCFDSLMTGANYSRRYVALQILVWCEQMHMDGFTKYWCEGYVDKLLLHLEDSYETNKSMALELLCNCPLEWLEKDSSYAISLELEDVLRQASCVKPTECASAAYKLLLLIRRLPQKIMQGTHCSSPEPVAFTLLQRLLHELRRELGVCRRSVVLAASTAPMYPLLHCMGHIVRGVPLRSQGISSDQSWSTLIEDIITTCMEVNAGVACVVNNSSPEGHLPMDMSGVTLTDHGNSSGVRLEDGRQVTAQVVLLCAWRSVKEVSLLLGTICSEVRVMSEGKKGTLSAAQVREAGEHFTKLLAETKHRGAFEQAYVGFTSLLTRLWRSRNPELHDLPHGWLLQLMETIASGDSSSLCATRRSAGLPFMIQALVTTELQVQSYPKCFHQCMATLLRLARPPKTGIKLEDHLDKPATNLENPSSKLSNSTCDLESGSSNVETRTHCVNILRALFRNSSLDESVAGYVGEGLMVALMGFEGDTWAERNSSTLLFSALMVRVFGVQRSRDSERLSIRNRMTGRIFFLRYPPLYDFMLDRLKEVSCSQEKLLRPSLYPILLLLARLYPSSLEGTVSNLKLIAFVPHVVACAGSGVLKTRQLAAKAVVPLVSPELYVSHLKEMLNLLCNKTIKRNYCHGILLQLTRLLDARPETLAIDKEQDVARLWYHLHSTLWILEQAYTQNTPCYLIADEYLKLINLILWRFPEITDVTFTSQVQETLHKLMHSDGNLGVVHSGRELCLANALYLQFIVSNKYNTNDVIDLIHSGLSHDTYELVLATLNYLLILYKHGDSEPCSFQQHLAALPECTTLQQLRETSCYITRLCSILKNTKYIECKQKCLNILTLEKDTEKIIVGVKINKEDISDDELLETLSNDIKNEHENFTHIYLRCLSKFVSKKLNDSNINVHLILEVIRVIYACSSSDNNETTRHVAVRFLERNSIGLLHLNLDQLSDEDKFEYKATLWSTLVTLLEDDSEPIRQAASDAVVRLSQGSASVSPVASVVASRAAELVGDVIAQDPDAVPILIVLALLDFRCEVCISDTGNDECRVFDHNERYNTFLEETRWTLRCKETLAHLMSLHGGSRLAAAIRDPTYKRTMHKLCNQSITILQSMINHGYNSLDNLSQHPKLLVLYNLLTNFS